MARTLFLAIITVTATLMAWAILRLFGRGNDPAFHAPDGGQFPHRHRHRTPPGDPEETPDAPVSDSRELLRSLFAFDEKLERESPSSWKRWPRLRP